MLSTESAAAALSLPVDSSREDVLSPASYTSTIVLTTEDTVL